MGVVEVSENKDCKVEKYTWYGVKDIEYRIVSLT